MNSLEKNQIRNLIKGKEVKLAKALKLNLSDINDNIIGDGFMLTDVYPKDHFIILKDRYKNILYLEINFWQVHFITHSQDRKNIQFDKKWLILRSKKLELNNESYVTSEIFIVNEDNINVYEEFGLFDIEGFLFDVEYNSLV